MTNVRPGMNQLSTQDCDQVRWRARRPERLSTLVAHASSRGLHLSEPPTLRDFGLKFANATLQPFEALCPAKGDDEPVRWGNAAWFAMLDPKHLGVAYDSDTVLVLERILPGAPVRPSFDCAKATSASETAICASQALAGYDRSVEETYQRVLAKTDAATRLKLEHGQRDYLAERDACKSDDHCLADTMSDRLGLLVQYEAYRVSMRSVVLSQTGLV